MSESVPITPAAFGSAPPPHRPIRTEWLTLVQEPALEPGREIVDAHHHLWDRPDTSGRYLAEEMLADIAASGHRVVQTVYVQARSHYLTEGPEELRPAGEVEFARGVAASRTGEDAQLCAGIVGCADLTLGTGVAPVLNALAEAGGGLLKGIRFPVAWHDDDRVRSSPVLPPRGLLLDTGFRAAARLVGRAGLSLDVWAYHTQLAELADFAETLPELIVVVDHAGGPLGVGRHRGRSAETFADWHAGISRLAALPNVRMKLGGLAMGVSGLPFADEPKPPSSVELAKAWRPWIETSIALFSPKRCMFESNFPVDKSMAGYGAIWNAFKRLSSSYSEHERRALFADTARDVYRLSATASG